MLDKAANVVMQPLTSQRGGHCLLHAEITLPYQFSVELQCLMFVRCRKVAAVNQPCSESCSNLFFTSLLFEHPNDGALTTGSSVRTRDSCCNKVSDQMREETAASGLPGGNTAKWTSPLAHIFILSHCHKPQCGPSLCRQSTHNLPMKRLGCSCELITRQVKLRKGQETLVAAQGSSHFK